MIVSVIVGGPASTAGLKAGDFIVSVNGEKVVGEEPNAVATKIRGPAGTQVTVEVLRPSTSEQLTFTMTRAKISFPPASWAFVPGTHIADLRLIQFSSGAADELRKVRDEAVSQGATGFILDLRSNPGGFVPEAVNTASLFLRDKTVYIRELADGERIPVQTNNDYPASDLPMVVLIDQGTASSSEIVSGAIQSAGRGQLVGETTFGTGTVLLTFNLNDGSAVRIAVERWLTPDGDLIFAKASRQRSSGPCPRTRPRSSHRSWLRSHRAGADDGRHADARGHPDPAGDLCSAALSKPVIVTVRLSSARPPASSHRRRAPAPGRANHQLHQAHRTGRQR
jgi:carboxyl-terminal processing protease